MPTLDYFYVNHKKKKRLIENLGSGFVDRKVGHIPPHSFVWISYVEDEGRKPYFTLRTRDGGMAVKDSRGIAYINGLDMESNEYLNRKLIAKRALKKKTL